MRKRKSTRKNAPRSRIAEFEALSDAQKEAVYNSLDREIDPSEMRPMKPADRRAFEKGRRAGRPKIGQGAEIVSVTIERDLLKRSDAFARQKGIKRSELVSASLSLVIDNPKLFKRGGAA
jgi:hypothetical protein